MVTPIFAQFDGDSREGLPRSSRKLKEMAKSRWVRFGLVTSPDDPYSPYYAEAMADTGLRFESPASLKPEDIAQFDVLVFGGVGVLDREDASTVAEWLGRGGMAVFSGSAWGAASLLGLKPGGQHLSVGSVVPRKGASIAINGVDFIKFYGSKVHNSAQAETLWELTSGGVGLSVAGIGRGKVWYLAPHLGQTTAQMVFGRSVETDAIGPTDGSARLDDGILRAEDGINLDYLDDRSHTEDGAPYFAFAHADALRELFSRCVLAAAQATGRPFFAIGQWPHGVEAAGLLSIDCDSNDEDRFNEVARMVANIGGRPVWMVEVPGYSQEVYRRMRGSLHEAGLLYSPDKGKWETEGLRLQHTSLARSASFREIAAVRPRDGRWHGHLLVYRMAESAGIKTLISKGGRQLGTSGFSFGSCRPTRPVHAGRPIEVYELPYAVYLPAFPDSAVESVLATVTNLGGCLHISSDLTSLESHNCQAALQRMIMLARQANLRFMLPSEIARHLRQRSDARIQLVLDEKGALANITPTADIEGLSLLVGNLPDIDPSINGRKYNAIRVSRHGIKMWSFAVDLEGKRSAAVTILATKSAAA